MKLGLRPIPTVLGAAAPTKPRKPRAKETKPRKKKPPVAGHARDSASGNGKKAGLAHVPVALEEACKTFETEAGGRSALVMHLAHGDLKTRDDLLVGAIADPRNDQHSLARICMLYDLKFADLLQLFRSAGFVKAQLAAMQHVWKRLPEVAGDVMDRSIPHDVVCSRCAGAGTITKKRYEGKELIETESECEDCVGRGKSVVQPKLDTQKVALQLGGLLIPGGAGVQVNVSQQQGLAAAPGFSDFYQRSDKVLYPELEAPPADEVEAEVVDAGGAPEA